MPFLFSIDLSYLCTHIYIYLDKFIFVCLVSCQPVSQSVRLSVCLPAHVLPFGHAPSRSFFGPRTCSNGRGMATARVIQLYNFRWSFLLLLCVLALCTCCNQQYTCREEGGVDDMLPFVCLFVWSSFSFCFLSFVDIVVGADSQSCSVDSGFSR